MNLGCKPTKKRNQIPNQHTKAYYRPRIKGKENITNQGKDKTNQQSLEKAKAEINQLEEKNQIKNMFQKTNRKRKRKVIKSSAKETRRPPLLRSR